MVVLIEVVKRRPFATLRGAVALGVIIAAVVGVVGDVGLVPLLVITVAIELGFLLAVVGGATTAVQVVVRRRRTKERRELARLNGWRCDARDDRLPAALGGRDYQLVDRYGQVFCEVASVPAAARAHAVVRGEAKGVAFTAFDYFLPGVFPVEVTTAWLIRLPHALPRFVSAELFWSPEDAPSPWPSPSAEAEAVGAIMNRFTIADGGDLAMRSHPEYARTIATAELVTFTRERMPSWWVDGNVLVATTHTTLQTHRRLGASARQLGLGIDAMVLLAGFLSSPRLAPHAT
jgi:hypothetical protein